jgi:ABC-type dipeptide/oligopeptide/nickel transport system permease subunit
MTAAAVLPERRARWRRITTDRWAVAGGVTVAVLLLIALSAPLLAAVAGQDPYTYHLDALDESGVPLGADGGIGAEHWFGVLPNLAATVIVYATLLIPGMIGAEAALWFLGVGVPPPTPAWGRSIGDAIAWVQTDPMFLVFPGAVLFVTTLAFNLLGDGLRDALDPKTPGVKS